MESRRTTAASMPPPPLPMRAGTGRPVPHPSSRTMRPPSPNSTAAPWASASTSVPPAPLNAPPPASETVSLPQDPKAPAPVLATEANVAAWPRTPGYRGYIDWLKRRCERIRGKDIVPIEKAYGGAGEAVTTYLRLLDAMMDWVREVPPLPQENQRFGNRAFRDYIALVERRLPSFFDQPLPAHLNEQILPLLLNSHAFGHPTRLDYGTGHELAFMLSLWCCVVSGWAGDERAQDDLVLRVFPRYLDLTTLLQSTYRLEPAGSHGVWGLDDYCFLPYLFGSAQLLNSSMTPPEALKLATTSSGPFTDLYTLSLHRITLFKHGAAFSEHSPLLNSLSQFPSWTKPHGGLLKMYQAEVLGKRVVVQGLWIGGWCWGADMPQAEREGNRREEPVADGGAATAAPWKLKEVDEANRSWGVGR